MQAEKFHPVGESLKEMASEEENRFYSALGRSKDGKIVEIPQDTYSACL